MTNVKKRALLSVTTFYTFLREFSPLWGIPPLHRRFCPGQTGCLSGSEFADNCLRASGSDFRSLHFALWSLTRLS